MSCRARRIPNSTSAGVVLGRTEEKIGALVHFISNGDQSDYVRKSLLDLEAQAKAERAAIASLVSQGAKPIALPSPDFALPGFCPSRSCVSARRSPSDRPATARKTVRTTGQGLCGPEIVARAGFEPTTFGL